MNRTRSNHALACNQELPVVNKKTSLVSGLLLAFSLTLSALPAWALDVPEREPTRVFAEPESRGLMHEFFSDLMPAWKPTLIPLEIPELKRTTLILPETFDVPTLTQRWHRGLLRLPFRPVRIGRQPRLPNDPETGVGLVFRLPVSF